MTSWQHFKNDVAEFGIIAMVIGAFVAVFATLALMIGALVTWSTPWSWLESGHGYPHQVTNLNYASTTVSPSARTMVLDMQPVADANTPMPSCVDSDLNPNGSTTQSGSGWSITFRDNAGQHDSIALPESQVKRVIYPGHDMKVVFHMSQVVFYYDQMYSSLWSTKYGYHGPKPAVIACESRLAPAQRMMVGLRNVTVFVPAHGGPSPSALAGK